jgi:hypothetical protein
MRATNKKEQQNIPKGDYDLRTAASALLIGKFVNVIGGEFPA